MFIGPIPPTEFLDSQLPLDTSEVGDPPLVCFKSVPTGSAIAESAMHAPLVRLNLDSCICNGQPPSRLRSSTNVVRGLRSMLLPEELGMTE